MLSGTFSFSTTSAEATANKATHPTLYWHAWSQSFVSVTYVCKCCVSIYLFVWKNNCVWRIPFWIIWYLVGLYCSSFCVTNFAFSNGDEEGHEGCRPSCTQGHEEGDEGPGNEGRQEVKKNLRSRPRRLRPTRMAWNCLWRCSLEHLLFLQPMQWPLQKKQRIRFCIDMLDLNHLSSACWAW